MTYKKLYHRIRESSGLDVLTENVLQTIIENCFADITSRGYREFNEKSYTPVLPRLEGESEEDYSKRYLDFFEDLGGGLYKIIIPDDYRKALHVKIVVDNKVYIAFRMSLSDERVNSITVSDANNNTLLRSNFAYLDKDAIYYTQGNDLYIELKDRTKEVKDIRLGYDKRLIAPAQPKLEDFDVALINIRREFEDAIVLFGIYFLLNRYSKDIDRIQIALNNYKYYIEDLTYTLAAEDHFNDSTGTICLERV